jgi:hypothetical protein
MPKKYTVDVYGLYGRTEKELRSLLSRSELDLVWLKERCDSTTGKVQELFRNQYFKELKYQNAIKEVLETLICS